jgi:PIN domain nuclease of toxin-antitoxin system
MYLLDTHTFIWSILEPGKLNKKVSHTLQERDNRAAVSAVSFWEISMKFALGKFSISGIDIADLPAAAKQTGFDVISLNENEAASIHKLPYMNNHRDPFDRMLIWQAIINKYTLISKDRSFTAYKEFGLKIFW